VHRGPRGQTLVLGMFLTHGGRGGTPQDAVLHTLPRECGKERGIAVDLASSLPGDLSTFRYDGSLTTAPYTEGVSWLMLRQHRAVTDAVVRGFEKLFPKGNARKLQPLNNRTVRFRRQRQPVRSTRGRSVISTALFGIQRRAYRCTPSTDRLFCVSTGVPAW
jgi:carbonic anhydrase